MKVRLNKKIMADMPEQLREIVSAWREKSRKAFIHVETRPEFYAPEDATVTVLNLLTGAAQSERVAGEWAGMTKFQPGAKVSLSDGIVAVVEEIFCGERFLTVYQGGKTQLA